MCTVVLVLMFAVPCAIKPSGVFLDSKLLLGFVFSLLVFRWQETYEDGSSYEGQLADGRQGPKSGIDLACFRKRGSSGPLQQQKHSLFFIPIPIYGRIIKDRVVSRTWPKSVESQHDRHIPRSWQEGSFALQVY